MIKSYEAPVDSDGRIRLPSEVRQILQLSKDNTVTLLVHDGIVHVLPGPLTLEEIRGSLPALDHQTDQLDDDTLLDAYELVLSERRA